METLQHATETRANKAHKCNFCCQPIEKGSKYLKSTHINDGSIYGWKTHIYCEKIATELNMYQFCEEGVSTEDFTETIREEFRDLNGIKYGEQVKASFAEQLMFVLKHYSIDLLNSTPNSETSVARDDASSNEADNPNNQTK